MDTHIDNLWTEIPVLEDDFERWEHMIVYHLENLGAWYFIKNQIRFDELKIANNQKSIEEYRELSRKVRYLLLRATKGFNNRLVREYENEDILEMWNYLKDNLKCELQVDSVNNSERSQELTKTLENLQQMLHILKELPQTIRRTFIEELIEQRIVQELREMIDQ